MPSPQNPEFRRPQAAVAVAALAAGFAALIAGPGLAGPEPTGSAGSSSGEPARVGAAQNEANGSPKVPADDGAETEGEDGQPPGRLGRLGDLIAKGKVNKGLIHPVFENGRLSSVLSAAAMTRRDDENLDIEGMRIELYNEPDGGKSFTIDLKTAVYHLMTDQLSSEDETVIEGKGFVLEGERMVFDTRSGVGRLMGAVKMTISDAASLALTGDETAPGDDAQPRGDGASGEPANDDSKANEVSDDAQ